MSLQAPLQSAKEQNSFSWPTALEDLWKGILVSWFLLFWGAQNFWVFLLSCPQKATIRKARRERWQIGFRGGRLINFGLTDWCHAPTTFFHLTGPSSSPRIRYILAVNCSKIQSIWWLQHATPNRVQHAPQWTFFCELVPFMTSFTYVLCSGGFRQTCMIDKISHQVQVP